METSPGLNAIDVAEDRKRLRAFPAKVNLRPFCFRAAFSNQFAKAGPHKLGTLIVGLALWSLLHTPSYSLGWVSPTGHQDPDSKWVTEASAYDGSTSSYAEDRTLQAGWGSYLILTLTDPIYSGRVRVYADFGYGVVDEVDVDIFKDGSWQDAWQGAILDSAWTELTFSAGTVTQARFRFRYNTGSWKFWLYEFEFLEQPPEIAPPVCATAAATSVEATAAVVHGSVIDDGGEPCDFRFEYGPTMAYGSSTAWTGSKVTEDTFGVLLSGLIEGTTYHYRAQLQNASGTASGLDQTFFTEPPETGWLTFTESSDPSDGWEDEPFAQDDEVGTHARSLHGTGDPVWGPFLYLSRPGILCDRIRFYAAASVNIDQVNVDVYKDGMWTDVYSGTFADQQWVEKSFPRGVVTEARIQFHVTTSSVGLYWKLYEFDFHSTNVTSVSGSFDGVTDLVLANDGVVVGTYTADSSPYLFSSVDAGAGDALMVYSNSVDPGTRAAVVTIASGTDIAGLDLESETLIVRSEHDGTPIITNSDLATAHTGEATVPFSVSGQDITLANGITFKVPTGERFNAGSDLFTFSKDLQVEGTFESPNASILLAGTDQSIYGSNTFGQLNMSVLNPATLTFQNNATQTITGALTLRGVSGNLLILRSDLPGAAWRIDPQGGRVVEYLDVMDSNSVNATEIYAGTGANIDSGGNSGWNFTLPTATPTITPTPSSTPSMTPTSTETPTQTPSLTPTVTDTPTETSTPTFTPTSTPTNVAPIVSLEFTPVEGPAPFNAAFIGSATDLDGLLVQYGWAFEDPMILSATGSLSSATHVSATSYTYAIPGVYGVAYWAWDDRGGISNASGQIVVWTPTPTFTPTVTETPTPTFTATATWTETPTATPTATDTALPTSTYTPVPPSPTYTETPTLTWTPTATQTETESPTQTPSASSSETATLTFTPTSTGTPTPSNTETPSPTHTPTLTGAPTETQTPNLTPTSSPTPAVPNSPTRTQTSTATPTETATHTPTESLTPLNPATATPSMMLTPTATSSHIPTFTQTPNYDRVKDLWVDAQDLMEIIREGSFGMQLFDFSRFWERNPSP